MKTKICFKCNKEKDIIEFYEDKRNKDGLGSYCKKCACILLAPIKKKWKENNPIRYWCQKTIDDHKYRGFKILFTFKDLLPIAEQTKKCPICNTKLNWSYGTKNGKVQDNSPTLDNMDNKEILTLKNIQILCHKCNRTKSNRNMKELYKWCENFIEKFKK